MSLATYLISLTKGMNEEFVAIKKTCRMSKAFNSDYEHRN